MPFQHERCGRRVIVITLAPSRVRLAQEGYAHERLLNRRR
jgi:hypothetical protein